MGDLFDFENVLHGNQELLNSLAGLDLENLLIRISRFSGRFVIILVEKGRLFLMHDAASARKVYYYRHGDKVCCSSQPHLLANIMGLKLTKEVSRLRFYDSEEFTRLNNANIGDTTCYDGVHQLIPNHYLQFNDCKTVRYWPNKKIDRMPFSEVIERSSVMIKGYVESITNRYKVMLPVTGGKDSRMLLASTFDIRDQVYYYINKEKQLNDRSTDIFIPKTLLSQLNLEFHIIDPYIEIDEDFRKIFFENNRFASAIYLPHIFNYYKNFSDRINLPGSFINIVEDVYEINGRDVTPQIISKLIDVEDFDFALEYYSYWLDHCRELCLDFDLNLLNLLYWEERIANWGTQIQLDKDIAQEDIIPYNSRLLIETMLSAELHNREKPDFTIFREITRMLWPETLQVPCNPDFKALVLKTSKSLGIMKQVKALYYLFYR